MKRRGGEGGLILKARSHCWYEELRPGEIGPPKTGAVSELVLSSSDTNDQIRAAGGGSAKTKALSR